MGGSKDKLLPTGIIVKMSAIHTARISQVTSSGVVDSPESKRSEEAYNVVKLLAPSFREDLSNAAVIEWLAATAGKDRQNDGRLHQ